ncbi:MAG: metalloregulator ArsR/SmtB family transcription factor [Actinomycetota bacterium]|nr:metalloregulator ArsR/SmtB family transcription factor [Actinomycetota bacterium]
MRAVHHVAPEEMRLPNVLHALGDPVRLEIVRALAAVGEQPCKGIEVSVAKSTLSHHLKVLRDAGLTRTRVEGSRRLVSLRAEEVDRRFPGLLESVLRGSTAA